MSKYNVGDKVYYDYWNKPEIVEVIGIQSESDESWHSSYEKYAYICKFKDGYTLLIIPEYLPRKYNDCPEYILNNL